MLLAGRIGRALQFLFAMPAFSVSIQFRPRLR
jgi:hypothetical protein